MNSAKSLNHYIEAFEPLMDDLGETAGKPQNLQIVGDYLYWTQGKKQILFRCPVTDSTPERVESVIEPHGKGEPTLAAEEVPKYSKEEELLRERMRLTVSGISKYWIRKDDSAVFYLAGLDLFVYYMTGARAHEVPLNIFSYLADADKKVGGLGDTPNEGIHFVSSNGGDTVDFGTVSFVNNGNLYLAFITENSVGSPTPISLTIQQITTIGDNEHQCGLADYIMQEEFDRFTGHEATPSHIIFSYTDQSKMRQVALLGGGQTALQGDGVERMAYSRVGDANAKTTIVVYDRRTQAMHVVPPESLGAVAPWKAEYIVRFGFKNPETIYLALLSRTQEEYTVVSCPIAALPVVPEVDLKGLYTSDGSPHTAPLRGINDISIPYCVEWKQQIPWAWVEVMPGPPIFSTLTHDVILAAAVESDDAHYHVYVRPVSADHLAWHPLTKGPWSVRMGSLKVHADKVSFLANAESRLSSVLYTVPLPKAGEPVVSHTAQQLQRRSLLTEHAYPSYGTSGETIYYVASRPTQAAQLLVRQCASADAVVLVNPEAWMSVANRTVKHTGLPPGPYTVSHLGHNLCVPILLTVTSRRGVPLSAQLFSTERSGATRQPLVVYVYGGPHVQLVYENDFDANCKAIVQALVSEGFAVAVIDNQMSNANGLRAHSVCKKRMGHFETEDYVDVVRHLCATPVGGVAVDSARVAVFGWSYGGYATLLALCQAPDVFRIGFAGAPVGDWTLYDTGYTERYMGLLYEEDGNGNEKRLSDAYQTSTIAHFAKGFPDELNRVYIAHGLLDENVHFGHSCHIINALVAEGKPYTILPYPGERHGLRQMKKSRLHHEAMLLKTLGEQLL